LKKTLKEIPISKMSAPEMLIRMEKNRIKDLDEPAFERMLRWTYKSATNEDILEAMNIYRKIKKDS